MSSTTTHTGRVLVTGQTATGTNQATALPLPGRADSVVEVTTVASSTGVLLPPIVLPMRVEIVNQGANTLSIYPQPGGTLNNGSVNAAVTVTAGNATILEASSLTNWYTVATTAASGGGIRHGDVGHVHRRRHRAQLDAELGCHDLWHARCGAGNAIGQQAPGRPDHRQRRGADVPLAGHRRPARRRSRHHPVDGRRHDALGQLRLGRRVPLGPDECCDALDQLEPEQLVAERLAFVGRRREESDPRFRHGLGRESDRAGGTSSGNIDGVIVTLENAAASTYPLRLIANSGSSSAGNLFAFLSDVFLDPGESLVLQYDDAQTAWRELHPHRDLQVAIWGSGKDGTGPTTGTTFTRTMYFDNWTIPSSQTFVVEGCDIYVNGILDISNATAGSITCNGNAGGAGGATGTAGTAPTSTLATGTCLPPQAGGHAGGAGSSGNGSAGTNGTQRTIYNGTNPGSGGPGGAGGTGSGGAYGSQGAYWQASLPYQWNPLFFEFSVPGGNYFANVYSGSEGGSGGGGGGDGTHSGGGGAHLLARAAASGSSLARSIAGVTQPPASFRPRVAPAATAARRRLEMPAAGAAVPAAGGARS